MINSFMFRELVGLIRYYKLRFGIALVGITCGLISLFMFLGLESSVQRHMTEIFAEFEETSFIAQVIPNSDFYRNQNAHLFRYPEVLKAFNNPMFSEFKIYPFSVDYQSIGWQDLDFDANIVFLSSDFIKLLGSDVKLGRSLHPLDKNHKVVVIGNTIAKKFQKKGVNPVDETLLINGEYYDVVGTLESKKISPLMEFELDNSILMDLSLIEHTEISYFSHLFVYTNLPIKSAEARLQKLFKDQLNIQKMIFKDAEVFKKIMFKQIDLTLNILKIIVALNLSLGCLALINILFILVEERSLEIGIRICVGASKLQIVRLFTLESATLCFMGGVIGFIVGIPCTIQLVKYLGINPTINWYYSVCILPVAILIGALSGIIPAILAAQKKPVNLLK